MNVSNTNVWDFVVDGLFVEYIVGLLGAVAATTNSFSALLYARFGKTVEDKLSTITANWTDTLRTVLGNSAQMLGDLASVEQTVFPIGQYIITFVLFIVSVLGIVGYAMNVIRVARAAPVAPAPVA